VPDAERMTVDERRKCLKRLQGRYLVATRQERSRLVGALAALTGLHRKRVVRRLTGPMLQPRRRARQRGRQRGAAVDDAPWVHWESLDHVCAQRLTPALLATAEQLARYGELTVRQFTSGDTLVVLRPPYGTKPPRR